MIRKIEYLYLILFLFMLYNNMVYANTNSYTLEYAANSPIKDIPLKNHELTLEIYQNAIPSGYSIVTTDQNQAFSIENNISFEIISIKDEEKYHARCYGTPTEGTAKIEITCQRNNQ